MPLLLKETKPKARKIHKCRTCGHPVCQIGETYTRATYVFDGSVYDWMQCQPCRDTFSKVWDWAGDSDEGIGGEQYWEWATEHRDDPDAAAYLNRVGWTDD